MSRTQRARGGPVGVQLLGLVGAGLVAFVTLALLVGAIGWCGGDTDGCEPDTGVSLVLAVTAVGSGVLALAVVLATAWRWRGDERGAVRMGAVALGAPLAQYLLWLLVESLV